MIAVEYRKLRRNKPPVLQVVAINNATNPITKEQFVREAMIDNAMRCKSVIGNLRWMSQEKGK